MKIIIAAIVTLFLVNNPAMAQSTDSYTLKAKLYSDNRTVAVKINKGKITEIVQLEATDDLLTDIYIAPGLIDIQINGYLGVDFSGPNLTVEDIIKATKALWEAGITTYYPTIITSEASRIRENFALLAKALENPEIGRSIPGFHLEGPYISPLPGFRGAHLEKYIKNPDWQEFQEFQQAANNNIKIITLAPELDGAISFVEKCVQSGVLVSLGHHNGSAEDIRLAVGAGAKMSTHLGNGCANEINRHHNPLWPQLSEDCLTPSIIADGFHLTREEVRSFYKVKGADNMVLVSDALDLAGLPPGEYIRGERKLLLTQNVVKLPEENVLAGAASPLSKCLGVVMEFTGCSLENAIKMASTNPAKLLSLDKRGKIAVGNQADLILFTVEDGEVIINKTFIAGELVYAQN